MFDRSSDPLLRRAVVFKSSRDGSTLEFKITDKNEYETQFSVSVKTPNFDGASLASTYHVGSPSELFNEVAREWHGWKGQKRWQDLESRVSLSAESDSLGHATFTVELQGVSCNSFLRTIFEFEAGQFDEMARAISEIFK